MNDRDVEKLVRAVVDERFTRPGFFDTIADHVRTPPVTIGTCERCGKSVVARRGVWGGCCVGCNAVAVMPVLKMVERRKAKRP